MDRTVKDLQGQIDRKDKQNSQLQDDVSRMRDKVDKLLKAIDELQASESSNQLSARRAERELREEKEKSLRLERELEGWKTLRSDKASSVLGSVAGSVVGYGSMRRSGTQATFRSALGGAPEAAGGMADDAASMVDIPKRKSSIGRTRTSRTPSLTKGFL